MRWQMPPKTRTDNGDERHVGVEVEYIGVSLEDTARIIARLWNGTVEWQHEHHVSIHCPELGKFVVELDVSWMQRLSEIAREERESDDFPLAELADKVLSPVVSEVAPNEIVTPPLPFSRLHEIDQLTSAMRNAGAKGTGESILYAFGVHLNPEVPSHKAADLLPYLQAFVLLYEWMKDQMDIDATRMLTGFAHGFPVRYAKKILSPGYAPGMAQMIDDYLADNPTRNRALDMLPFFAFMDEKRVRAMVEDTLVKSRPTFHFRMPNCRINEAGWGIADAWHYWLQVEKLAGNPQGLHHLGEIFLQTHRNPTHYFTDEWLKQTAKWLHENHESA